jgi:hypothetical protein
LNPPEPRQEYNSGAEPSHLEHDIGFLNFHGPHQPGKPYTLIKVRTGGRCVIQPLAYYLWHSRRSPSTMLSEVDGADSAGKPSRFHAPHLVTQALNSAPNCRRPVTDVTSCNHCKHVRAVCRGIAGMSAPDSQAWPPHMRWAKIAWSPTTATSSAECDAGSIHQSKRATTRCSDGAPTLPSGNSVRKAFSAWSGSSVPSTPVRVFGRVYSNA